MYVQAHIQEYGRIRHCTHISFVHSFQSIPFIRVCFQRQEEYNKSPPHIHLFVLPRHLWTLYISKRNIPSLFVQIKFVLHFTSSIHACMPWHALLSFLLYFTYSSFSVYTHTHSPFGETIDSFECHKLLQRTLPHDHLNHETTTYYHWDFCNPTSLNDFGIAVC
jgi:hypothetical protein